MTKTRGAIAAMALAFAVLFSGLPAALFGPGVEAQSAVLLVGNLGKGALTVVNDKVTISSDGTDVTQMASSFETGSNADGYTLTSFVGNMKFGGSEAPIISVYSDSSGNPGSSLYTLTNPASLPTSDAFGQVTFTGDSNTLLEPDTTYWIVASTSVTNMDSYQWRLVGSTLIDGSSLSGWDIPDGSKTKTGSGAWSNNQSFAFHFDLNGTVTEAESTSVTLLDNFATTDADTTSNNLVAIGGSGTAIRERAAPFETGSNPAGYTLGSVTVRLKLGTNETSMNPQMAIHSDSSGVPGSNVVGTLTQPDTIPSTVGNHDLTFTSSDGVSLDPDTVYHVVMTEGTSGNLYRWFRTRVDTGTIVNQPGWSLPGPGLGKQGTAAWTSSSTSPLQGPGDDFTYKFKLEGVVNPTPPGVTVSETSFTLDEAGGTGTYTVVLDAQPANDVTIAVASDDTADVTVSPSSLTFTTTNWETAQTVTVNAVDNDFDEPTAGGATIGHTATSDDADYSGIDIDDVTVTVTDDDTAGVTLSETSLDVTEGSSTGDTYTIVLTSAPIGGSATITPGSTNTALAFNPASVTFSNSTWDQAQTVRVTANDDDNLVDETSTITHTVTGYTATAGSITVNVADSGSTDEGSMVEPGVSTIWSATLTPGSTSGVLGCSNGLLSNKCNDSSVLSEDGFTYNGDDYAFKVVFLRNSGNRLDIEWTPDFPAAAEDLTLTVDGTTFAFSEADSNAVARAYWDTSGLSWTAGTDVSMSLTQDTSEPTVTFLNNFNTVTGSSNSDSVVGVGTSGTDVLIKAAPFQTGSDVGGYTLESVTVNIIRITGPMNPQLAIYSDSSGEPGTSVATLSQPATIPTTSGIHRLTFTSSDGVSLDPDTVYYVVMSEGTDGQLFRWTRTKRSGSGLVNKAGWSFNDNGIGKTGDGAWALTARDTFTYRLKLEGKVNPPKGVTVSKSTLTIAEGGTDTYTVVLDAEPDDSVTIAVASDDTDEVTVSPGTLTFTTSNWDTAQTVTVTAVDDDFVEAASATITHTATSTNDDDYDGFSIGDVTVTVTDDDMAGVTISETSLDVTEGSSTGDTYTIVLDSAPVGGGSATITPSSTNSALAFNPASVTFDADDWDTAVTVRVTATDDDDLVDETSTITHAVTGSYTASAASITVNVDDVDMATITVSTSTVDVTEGSSTTYTIVLDQEPAGNVVVTPSSGDTSVVTVSGALTFTSQNWNTSQTVTVTAPQETDLSDVDDEEVTITHAVASTADTNYNSATAASVTVTVDDDDVPGVTFTPAALTIDEGAAGMYTVVLNTDPGAAVTVTPSVTGLTVSPASLMFTSGASGNWGTAQTVTVTSAQDTNLVDDDYTISHAITGYSGVTSGDVKVTVEDDDNAGVTVSPTTLTVNEGSTEDDMDVDATYTVVLDFQPSANVTVTINKPSGTDLTIDKSSLTFTDSNWNTAQTVTVTASEDDDGENDSATIGHSVTSTDTNYNAVSASSVVITVDDEDEPGVTFSRTNIGNLDEGASQTFTVKLDTLPSGNVTVEFEITPPGVVTIDADAVTSGNQDRVTFTRDDWSTPKTVTLTGRQDDDAYDNRPQIDIFVEGYTGVDDVNEIETIYVTVNDDESVGIELVDTDVDTTDMTHSKTVTEGTSTEKYKVKLTSRPVNPITGNNATATLTIGGFTGTDVSVSPTTLTFGSDWDTAKEVTITAAQDADGVEDVVTVTHATSGADYGNVSAFPLTVKVTDDDTAGLTFADTPVTITELGTVTQVGNNAVQAEGTYSVKLNTQPTAEVTMALAFASGSSSDVKFKDSSNNLVSTLSLTFTTTNWNTAQTITVSAASDDDAVTDTATITHTASQSGGSQEYDGTTGSVTVTVNDDEVPAVTITPTSIDITEGQMVKYRITLSARPSTTANVWPAIAAADQDTLTDTVNFVAFSTSGSDWRTGKEVEITAEEDDDGDDKTVTITFTTSGAEFQGLTVTPLTVSITDDDERGLEFSNLGAGQTLDMDEGETKSYEVKLKTKPSGDVVVTPEPASDARISIFDKDDNALTSLTFTTMNWNDSQTVRVKSDEDPDAQDNSYEITHDISGYGTLDASEEPDPITVNIDDDEMVGVEVTIDAADLDSDDNLIVIEQDSTGTSISVRLTSQPVDDDGDGVSVSLISTTSGGLNVTPSPLVFPASSWSQSRTLTIKGRADDNGVNETARISFRIGSVTPNDYDGLSIDDIPVVIEDDDEPGLTISETSFSTVNEGSPIGRTYTVKPDTEPSAEFTVNIASDHADITVSPATLTFDSSNWQTAKTVRITAPQDDDAFDETATITHTTSMTTGDHLEYDGLTVDSVTATAHDDDTQGVNVSVTTLTVDEGDSGTYTITLDTLPVDTNGDASSVTINIAEETSEADITHTASVTLDENNWDTGATVTVTAANDDDTTRETATLQHTVSSTAGADYVGETIADVAVTANDDDTEGVSISETTLTPDEGGTATYTVKLNTQPTGNVTVTASSNNADVTLSATSLTFTSTTWNTEQTVTVNAAEDADAAVDTATITHGVSGAEYSNAPTPGSITVNVTENDTLQIDVSPVTLAIDEVDGGTGSDTYSVTLHAAPTGGSVTIQINATGDDNVTVNPTSLTFSAGEWATPTTPSVSKTVTVNVSDDPDATSPETATIEHTVSGSSDYQTQGIASGDVTVTVTDTDTRGVSFSTTSVSIAEGTTNANAYTIVLDTRPTGAVTVTINDPTDNNVFETDPASLSFTAANWNTPQPVSLRALTDDDANDDDGTVTHTVSGADYTQTPAIDVGDVTVTSTDGNTRSVEIDTTDDPYLMGEGETITYRVKLGTEPEGTVTITPVSTNADISFNPASLDFDDSDWDDYQTISVTAGQDDDAAPELATITHEVTGGDYGSDASLTVDNVNLDIADDDEANVVVPITELSVTEGSSSGYTIALGSRPVGGNVTITLAMTSGSDPDITISPATLTFTTSTWNLAQLVTVAAAHDTDTRVDRGTITHDVSGANFTGATVENIAVTVVEDDMAMITIEPTEITIGEGNFATYTVVLGTEPSGDVTIRAVSDNSDVTLSPSTLTFKPSADPGEGQWDEPQVITATAADDPDAENETASVSHTASGHEYEGEVGSTVTVKVVEDGSDVKNTSSFLRSSSCDSNLSLTWNAPVVDGTIATYSIHWAPTGTSYNDSDSVTVSGDSTSYLLGPLDNDTEYSIRMQEFDAMGDPLWSREVTAKPADDSCITEVTFGNILADSTPVIVKMEGAVSGTQVNMRYRSLNPGVWSEILSQVLGEGETSATFDIRGLRPDNPYEVQVWLGSTTPPLEQDDSAAVETSVAQAVFKTGALPEGEIFTGGGGSRGGRILRIEPAITSVNLGAGDTVVLSVDVWGRQNILDNGLADRDARHGRPEFKWFSDAGGAFTEADIRPEWQNGLADDRAVVFTAPSHGGTISITASLEDSFLCLAAQDDETADDQSARCTAEIEVTVFRRATTAISTTAPVNPHGPIPETLSGPDGVAHAIFTPVEGGSFVGAGYSLSAGPGAVADGEYIGISMTPAGDASNVGMTWHRYTLAGLSYSDGVIDASGAVVSAYSLNEHVSVCVPMPAQLGANLTDIVLISISGDGDLSVLSTKVKITAEGVSVCGNLSTVPATVAVGKVGAPLEVKDAEPENSDQPLPDTGGSPPTLPALILMFTFAVLTVSVGMMIFGRNRPGRCTNGGHPLAAPTTERKIGNCVTRSANDSGPLVPD